MLTPFPMDFPHTPVTPQHAVIIDDVIIIGRHLGTLVDGQPVA